MRSRPLFILIFLLLISTVLLGSAAVSATLVVLFDVSSRPTTLALWIIPAALTLSFVGSMFLNAYFFNVVSRITYMITAVWTGCLVYLLLASVLSSIGLWAGLGKGFGLALYSTRTIFRGVRIHSRPGN